MTDTPTTALDLVHLLKVATGSGAPVDPVVIE